MKYEPPKTKPVRSTAWMQVHAFKESGLAHVTLKRRVNQPCHTIECSKRRGSVWGARVTDETGIAIFDGYLDGSESAKSRDVLTFLMEHHGLR